MRQQSADRLYTGECRQNGQRPPEATLTGVLEMMVMRVAVVIMALMIVTFMIMVCMIMLVVVMGMVPVH